MTGQPERTALYRIWGEADLLLYIGVSNSFGRRWEEHAKQQPWWPEMRRLAVDEWFDRRKDAEDAEEAAIKAEKPKYNKKFLVPPARRQRKPRRVLAPVVATVEPAEPPTPRVYGSSAPYPYSLLGIRLPEPDLSDLDLTTSAGKFAAAKAYYAYEQKVIRLRRVAEGLMAEARFGLSDPTMWWAWPALRKIRLTAELVLGNGGDLTDTDKASAERIAAVLRDGALALEQMAAVEQATLNVKLARLAILDAAGEDAA